jgi:hypothetical protein
MSKRYLFLFFVLLGAACKDYPDPMITVTENISFTGNSFYPRGIAGSYLNDSIQVFARDIQGYWAISGYQIRFRATKGGGETEEEVVHTNRYGKASNRWKLGESGTDQQLEAILLDQDGKRLTTLNFQAYGFKPDRWDSIFAYPEWNFTDMAADTLNRVTLAVSYNGIFRQGERYFDWNQIYTLQGFSPGSIKVGSDGTFYTGTWQGQLLKSFDQGVNWLSCASPWSDYESVFDLRLTSENYLWAAAAGKELRCSRDGGNTWATSSQGLSNADRPGDIFRLTDGTLFLLSLNMQLYKSVDDGQSWMTVITPANSAKLFVTKKDELILFNQENGISIYKSVDKGDHFAKEYTVTPANYTLMEHNVHLWKQNYYLLIPGYGVLQTIDFETFSLYWKSSNAYDMLMDDEGTLIVRGQYNGPVYYRHNTNP